MINFIKLTLLWMLTQLPGNLLWNPFPHMDCFINKDKADCSNKNLTNISLLNLPKNITTLDLSGNIFVNVPDTFFESISESKIEILIMSRCCIQNISHKAFSLIPYVHSIDLNSNNLTPETVREGLKSLSGSKIKNLNISNIYNPSRLLPKRLLLSLQKTNITSLTMRKWNLLTVEGFSFQILPSLKILDLSQNEIQSINMSGFSKLELLNLTWNELFTLPNMCDYANKSLVPELKKLYIAINHLSDSSRFLRQGHCLPNLYYLNISFNAIRIFKSNSFSNLKKLSKLRMGNMLTYDMIIENDALNSTSLKKLFFGSYIRVSKKTFNHTTLFKNCKQIAHLEMSIFDFSDFSINEFRIMLSPLKNLEVLILRQTMLYTVPDISMFPRLKTLNLEENWIRQVHKDYFLNNSRLEKISFRKNQITTVREDSFTDEIWKQPNLSIDISHNPFACDCDLEWFLKWAYKKGVISKNSEYQCDSPKKWKGTQLDVLIESLKTGCHRLFVTILTACSLGFIFVFIMILVWKLRWDIKYYLHKWTNRKRTKYRALIERELKEYDGFVAYNTHDRKWIMSELVDVMEQKENYKLCLHERNFLPSCAHVDNILESIEASRKFILVLSNNFMEDQWCNYETIIANHKLADGNGDRVFLILLGKISSKHFTIALKTLLKSVENVEWTLNENGRKLFWNKLKSFMRE